VWIAKKYETWLGRFANYHLCVSEAMKKDLKAHFNVDANVMYDRATDKFYRPSLKERHELFEKIFKKENTFTSIVSKEV
jgi:hypothetical protein